jgi:hypothetical protein
MFAGTVLCLLFSDPMVDCLGALGDGSRKAPPHSLTYLGAWERGAWCCYTMLARIPLHLSLLCSRVQ